MNNFFSNFPHINCKDYGALPYSVYPGYAHVGLKAAYDAAAAAKLPLLIPPGYYIVNDTVDWTSTQRVDVWAQGAIFGMYISGTIVVYGAPSGSNVSSSRLTGLSIVSPSPMISTNCLLLQLQNITNATIDIGGLQGSNQSGYEGVLMKIVADNADASNNRIRYSSYTYGNTANIGFTSQNIGTGASNNNYFYNDVILLNVPWLSWLQHIIH